ncbi:hypothetical protein IFM89_003988 [Coptis chinensis]|uniref:PHD finger protein ALFIN-LIKE n=1 Tax=Coptis chinensis TaxID=261450 RepID=A0A835H145_9MAGN|nr:hypothetical protein IFM89_003988 [Coptis chinensis]
MASIGQRKTVEEIFKDYSARRTGIVRALTHDVDQFYGLCDPDKDNLCLYGYANESWEVTLPAEEVPAELPEPALGINFARDGMNRKDWLSLVAVHSDSWLISVAFFLGASFNGNESHGTLSDLPLRFNLPYHVTIWSACAVCVEVQLGYGVYDKGVLFSWKSWCSIHGQPFWKRLFSLINDLPTVFEVVTGKAPVKDKLGMDSGSKPKHGSKRSVDGQLKSNPKIANDAYEEDDDDDEHSETICGSCSGVYNANEFWIGCDICERWYHGKCVKITPAKAESIKQYKCPSCSMRKGRQ